MKALQLHSKVLRRNDWLYLGDGVSVQMQGKDIHLNENSHTVILTPATLKAFLLYLEGLNEPHDEDGKWSGLKLWTKKLRSSGDVV